MKCYAAYLTQSGLNVHYVEATSKLSDIRMLIKQLNDQGFAQIRCYDPVDDWLQRRITDTCEQQDMKLEWIDTQLFINSSSDTNAYFKSDNKNFRHAHFYKEQRIQHNILVTDDEQPIGQQWSFDADNRKKYPRGKQPPKVELPALNGFYEEARNYVEEYFNQNPGTLSQFPIFPIDHNGAQKWLEAFLTERLEEFGPYEDAIVSEEPFLNHSVLSPMINVGLITPNTVVDRCVQAFDDEEAPIQSVEGFIRQVIGWREFVRGIYIAKGRYERTRNFWSFNRKMPDAFYDGTTGIEPVDNTIKKVLATGYCHHIERLMILGNFMLLCEIDPDDVYRWFMELFVDAFDWVMVPNVYGMSQFADGGIMSTKPYISGSNYVMKMSNYKKGEWQNIWDALFWRFMHVHRDFLSKNPRLKMLITVFDKRDKDERSGLISTAENFLGSLFKEKTI